VSVNSLIVSILGVEYIEADVVNIGRYVVKAGSQPVDVVDNGTELLDVGGYSIRYIDGSYLLPTSPSKFVVGGVRGLNIRWSRFANWTQVQFAIREVSATPKFNKFGSDGLMFVEFTRPHKMQLIPPSVGSGNVVVEVAKFTPKCQLVSIIK